jgi:hypothetical protein
VQYAVLSNKEVAVINFTCMFTLFLALCISKVSIGLCVYYKLLSLFYIYDWFLLLRPKYIYDGKRRKEFVTNRGNLF